MDAESQPPPIGSDADRSLTSRASTMRVAGHVAYACLIGRRPQGRDLVRVLPQVTQ